MSARLLFSLTLCVACDCTDKSLCPEPFVEGDFECECPPEWELEDGWCILPDGGRVPIPGVDAAVDSGADASVATDASLEEDAAAADVGTDAAPEDAGTDAERDGGPKWARGCLSNDDCPEGEFCFGPSGCGETWECRVLEPPPPCFGPTEPFCGCDGETFEAPPGCAFRPYTEAGACCLDVPGDPSLEACTDGVPESECLTRFEECEDDSDCPLPCDPTDGGAGDWRMECDFSPELGRAACFYSNGL